MKAPLLFDEEPSEHERYIRGLEAESAFSVKPNAGQVWDIKAGVDENGKPVYKRVKIIAVANNSPKSLSEPLVIFRNSRKELHSWPVKDWIDGETFLVSTPKD